jgi:hypothetical protein
VFGAPERADLTRTASNVEEAADAQLLDGVTRRTPNRLDETAIPSPWLDTASATIPRARGFSAAMISLLEGQRLAGTSGFLTPC